MCVCVCVSLIRPSNDPLYRDAGQGRFQGSRSPRPSFSPQSPSGGCQTDPHGWPFPRSALLRCLSPRLAQHPPPPAPLLSLSQDLNQVLLEVADLTRRPERRPVPPGGTPVPIVSLMTACWSTCDPPTPPTPAL